MSLSDGPRIPVTIFWKLQSKQVKTPPWEFISELVSIDGAHIDSAKVLAGKLADLRPINEIVKMTRKEAVSDIEARMEQWQQSLQTPTSISDVSEAVLRGVKMVDWDIKYLDRVDFHLLTQLRANMQKSSFDSRKQASMLDQFTKVLSPSDDYVGGVIYTAQLSTTGGELQISVQSCYIALCAVDGRISRNREFRVEDFHDMVRKTTSRCLTDFANALQHTNQGDSALTDNLETCLNESFEDIRKIDRQYGKSLARFENLKCILISDATFPTVQPRLKGLHITSINLALRSSDSHQD
ncbi:MAG: hypothetical protein TREMPRED_000893 [Tremellales sp. Tagirdzhanova-0007]|nr:MAG: hypothetical protein TREMPRED_000893 [Tremellales sp. Tagirdzhanova-0007]